jgi:hypothetical protein
MSAVLPSPRPKRHTRSAPARSSDLRDHQCLSGIQPFYGNKIMSSIKAAILESKFRDVKKVIHYVKQKIPDATTEAIKVELEKLPHDWYHAEGFYHDQVRDIAPAVRKRVPGTSFQANGYIRAHRR